METRRSVKKRLKENIQENINWLIEMTKHDYIPLYFSIHDDDYSFGDYIMQRTAMFSVLCKVYSDSSWISYKLDNGKEIKNKFIACIITPKGQYSFFINRKYEYMFDGVKHIEQAPTLEENLDDIERLLSLEVNNNGK